MENVSEAVARIMKKHSVPVAMSMKPYRTLKTVRHLVRFGQCWVRFGELQDRGRKVVYFCIQFAQHSGGP